MGEPSLVYTSGYRASFLLLLSARVENEYELTKISHQVSKNVLKKN